MNNGFVIKLSSFESIEGYKDEKILPVIFSSLDEVKKVIVNIKRLNSYVSLYYKDNYPYRIPNNFADIPVVKESDLENEEWYIPYNIALDYEYRVLEVPEKDPHFERILEIKRSQREELENSFRKRMNLSLEYFKIGDIAVSNEWDLFNVSLQDIQILELESEKQKKEMEDRIYDMSSEIIFGSNFSIPLFHVIHT